MSLDGLDSTQWRNLRKAGDDPRHPFRNVTLATLGTDGVPQARYLILRGADAASRTLVLHTDVRSAKWAELAANPHTTLLAYDAQARVQLRLTGTIERHPPGTPRNDAAWAALGIWARKTYCGGPPGVVTDWAETDEAVASKPPSEAEVEHGRDRFGVLMLQVSGMDWFKHPRGDIRRAQMTYASDGSISTAHWVEP